jgi:SecD/SecF fusion protein
MAVDANVLIFERMKEELRTGKTLLSAIDAGFKRAFTAIFDSNACTIITCVVLYELGTGPVQGFASTLGIGVAISLFTAITLTRMLLYTLVSLGVDNPKYFALGTQWFGGRTLQIIRRMGIYFAISLAVLIPGTIFWAIGGVKRNIEFDGGAQFVYNTKSPVHLSNSAVANLLAPVGIPDASVQLGPSEHGSQIIIKTKVLTHYPALKNLNPFDARARIAQALAPAGVNAALVNEINPATQKLAPKIADETSFDEVGGMISGETTQNAILAVLISLGIILGYISIRFAIEGGWSGVKFGLSAIGATFHDALVVISAAAIFGYFMNWEISSLFMTAVLTIIGFSTHDTIVIFDRIRENLRLKKKGETFEGLTDRSITQSFARSINTSLTVWFMVLSLLVFGSVMPDLRHFNAIMFIGIVSGAYSSIFNASPILVLIERWHRARGGKTLEAAVKERDRRVTPPAPKIASGDSTGFAQTGRSPSVEEVDGGEDFEPGTHKPSAKPKSKKPKRRF